MSKAARSESRRRGCSGWPSLALREAPHGHHGQRVKATDRGEPHPRSSLALAAQGGVTAETGVE
jgi:hypothetical protein